MTDQECVEMNTGGDAIFFSRSSELDKNQTDVTSAESISVLHGDDLISRLVECLQLRKSLQASDDLARRDRDCIMPKLQDQIWKGSPFNIERRQGKTPRTVILRFHGPFTARDMYGSLTPFTLSNILEVQSPEDAGPPSLSILDLTDVPYMDSAGLGMIVRHYVRCKSKGVRLIAAGVGSRVLDLFKLTKVDGLIPVTSTVEKAEAR
jgi:anti-anti-sigma factor